PDTAQAPALGQELAQAELLANILLDAHVEAIVSWRRVSPNERSLGVSTPTPSPARKPAATAKPGAPALERNVIDLTFIASPGAMRRVLNQIASAPSQLFVVRTLHILNEKEKGPPREGAAPNVTAPPPAPAPAPAPGQTPAVAALNFVVGSEHVQTSARVEMLKWGGN
ncbi:MAG: Amuc_1100 family pilus-like protein, partial [Verrucomicrobiota bacterium]|nr:Amuc_1100 family pilus-like protein [Verrucomicrobiota bacterium]